MFPQRTLWDSEAAYFTDEVCFRRDSLKKLLCYKRLYFSQVSCVFVCINSTCWFCHLWILQMVKKKNDLNDTYIHRLPGMGATSEEIPEKRTEHLQTKYFPLKHWLAWCWKRHANKCFNGSCLVWKHILVINTGTFDNCENFFFSDISANCWILVINIYATLLS